MGGEPGWGGGGGGGLGAAAPPSCPTTLVSQLCTNGLEEAESGALRGHSISPRRSKAQEGADAPLLRFSLDFFPSQGRKSGRNEAGTLLFFFVCFVVFFLHITLVPNNCRANYLQQQSLRGGKGLQLSPLATAAIRTHLFKMNESVGP